MRNWILGVDGGGTKTNVAAYDAETGSLGARGTAGGINVYFDGPERAAENLKAAIESLSLAPEDRILGLGIGDPALDDSVPEAGRQLREWGAALLPEGALCVSGSDVLMALYAFAGGKPGALVVAGTGSMGVALREPYRHGGQNTLLTVGGWGQPTTDPGSGNDIGTRGICAALDAFDGTGPETALCGAVLAFFGAEQPRELVDIFNGDRMRRSQIAAFSRQVAQCADAGDPVSRAILEAAGQHLGKYARSLLRQAGQALPVGAYGSVLVNNGFVRRVFAEEIQKEFPQARVRVPAQPPEYGAALFAAHALGIQWEEES